MAFVVKEFQEPKTVLVIHAVLETELFPLLSPRVVFFFTQKNILVRQVRTRMQ